MKSLLFRIIRGILLGEKLFFIFIFILLSSFLFISLIFATPDDNKTTKKYIANPINPTDDLISVFPQSIPYYTGTTTEFAYTDNCEVRGWDMEDGWMMFDVSGIPVGSTITNIEFHGFVNDTYWPDWSITPVSINPLSSSPMDLYMDINGEANTASQCYLYQSEDLGYTPGWKTHTLINTANSDLEAKLADGWFVIGIASRDNSPTYYIVFDGWCQSNLPYLLINYILAGAPGEPFDPDPADGATNVPISGNLTWEFGADTDTYDLWFGEAGAMTDVVTGASAGPTGIYPYSDLNYNTEYEWQVIAHSAVGPSTSGPVWNFTTECEPVYTFPWLEEFTVWPPDCWDLSGGTFDWVQYIATPCAKASFWSHNSPNNCLMTTPFLDISTLNNPVLEFQWSHLYSSTYPDDQLDVSVSEDGGEIWTSVWNKMGSELDSEDGATNTTPGTFVSSEEIDLSGFGSEILIQFNAISGYGPDLFVDDVEIKESTTQTYVSGEVYGTWTFENSPYIATAELEVPEDSTLTIEEDVQVIFNDDFKFQIKGSLIANKAEFYLTGSPPPAIYSWRGLVFKNTSFNCTVDSCDIINASPGIEFTNTSQNNYPPDPLITNNNFIFSNHEFMDADYALRLIGHTSPRIENNYFEGYILGIRINPGQYAIAVPELINNEFNLIGLRTYRRENSIGCKIEGASNIITSGNKFLGFDKGFVIINDVTGTLAIPKILNTIVRNNPESSHTDGYGIHITGFVEAHIDSCEIEDYNYGIYYIGNGTATRDTPILSNNRVRSSPQSSRNDSLFIGIYLENLINVEIDSCEVYEYLTGIEIYNDTSTRTLSTPVLTNNRVRNSPESSRLEAVGLKISGYVSAYIENCDIEDYENGIEYIGTGSSFPTRDTPMLTNNRVRSSPQSSRASLAKGIYIDSLSAIVIDDCDIEDYKTGIEILNNASWLLSTPTLTNNRVRSSPQSSREQTFGIKISGYTEADIDSCLVEDYNYGIYYIGNGTATRDTPILSNNRVRSSPQSSRNDSLFIGIYLENLINVEIDSCEVYEYLTGIEIYNDTSTRTLSTPVLTNNRVRNSPESSRLEAVGLKISGYVSAYIENCDIEDYENGIEYIGTGEFTSRDTPVLANNRVRNSPESSRLNDLGIYIENLLYVEIDSCEIEDYATAIKIFNSTMSRETSTPVLTNNRVRNSPESSRDIFVGLRLSGDVDGTVEYNEFIDCDSALVINGLNANALIRYNLIYLIDVISNSTAIYAGDSDSLTINDNTVYQYDYGLISLSTVVNFSNNIFWKDSPTVEPVTIDPAFLTGTYNDISRPEGELYPGVGNINVEPMFVDVVAEDFNIEWNSFCIDVGDPYTPFDPDGTVNDIGLYYFNQPDYLDIPANITFNIAEGNVNLSWDLVSGAIGYNIYTSSNPYSEWILYDFNVRALSWSEPVSGEKKFYHVKAYNSRAVDVIRKRDAKRNLK